MEKEIEDLRKDKNILASQLVEQERIKKEALVQKD